MGFFTTLWLQHGLRLGTLAAGMGGVMVMFGGPFYMHIHGGHLSNLSVMVWVPLLLLAIGRWFDGAGTQWLALGSVAVAMQIFGGHPQYLYYTGLVVLLLTGWHLLRRSQRRRRDSMGIAAIYLSGTLLGAVQLLPGLEAAGESVRANGTSQAFAGTFSLPPAHLVSLIAPHLLDLAPDKTKLWETSLYFGLLVIFLAVIGIGHPERGRARGFALLMTVMMVLALGAHTPLFSLLYHHLPGFDLFRGTTKFAFFALLFAAALAAMGITRLQQSTPQETARYAAPLAVAAIGLATALLSLYLLTAWTGGATVLAHPEGVRTITLDFGIAVAVLAAAALLMWSSGRGWRHAIPLLALILGTELYYSAATHLPWFYAKESQHHPVVKALRTLRDDARVHNQDYRNASMLAGSYELWGNDPGLTRRWAEFVAYTGGFATPENQSIAFAGEAPQLAIARLGWHLRTTADSVVMTPAATPPLPHALLFYSVEALAREPLLARLAAPTFDFRHTLLIESPPPFAPGTDGRGNVTLLDSTINSLDLRIVTTTPAVLLVTDAYSKG